MDLDLCNGCRRHVRTTESTCPFCGAPRAAGAPTPHERGVSAASPRSRAQRYVLGAAVAAGIGIAKASAAPSADAGSDAMAVAADPSSAPSQVADGDAGPPGEDAGTAMEQPRDFYKENYPMHQGGGPCSTPGCCGGPVICPPYGCVFPDEDVAIAPNQGDIIAPDKGGAEAPVEDGAITPTDDGAIARA